MYALHTPYSWYAVFLPPYIYIFGVSHNDTAFDTFAHLFFWSFKIFSPFVQYFFLCVFLDRILFGCRSVYFYRWTDPLKKPKEWRMTTVCCLAATTWNAFQLNVSLNFTYSHSNIQTVVLTGYASDHNNEIKYLYDGKCDVINSKRNCQALLLYFIYTYTYIWFPLFLLFRIKFAVVFYVHVHFVRQMHKRKIFGCRRRRFFSSSSSLNFHVLKTVWSEYMYVILTQKKEKW